MEAHDGSQWTLKDIKTETEVEKRCDRKGHGREKVTDRQKFHKNGDMGIYNVWHKSTPGSI